MTAEGELFHVTTPETWATAQHTGAVTPPSLTAEGFVHCSTRDQLVGTIERHFATADTLVLLQLEATTLEGSLHWEESRPGEVYPHVYRPLATDDVVRAVAWQRSPDGSVALPPELA